MKISGILIRETGEIIYSRSRHDFRWDSTHKYAIDGGQNDYGRVCFEKWEGFHNVEFELDVTLEELHNDYNKCIDKYGLIGPMDKCEFTILKK